MNTIPITKIHPFEEHPYKVLDNEEMNELIHLRSTPTRCLITRK